MGRFLDMARRWEQARLRTGQAPPAPPVRDQATTPLEYETNENDEITRQGVADCPRCPWSHPQGCPTCCLPVDGLSVRDLVHIPDAASILQRWHSLGHPDVRLEGVRKVQQLPLWLLLTTSLAQRDLEAVRLALGLDAGGTSCQ